MKRTIYAAIAAFFFIGSIWTFGLRGVIATIAWTVAGAVIVTVILGIYFFIRLKTIEIKSANYDAKAKKYLSYQDGFGMTHLLNLKTDTIENLSAFPGTHHNGRWEEPHPAAAQAWFALINKRSGESPAKMLLPEPQKQLPNLLDILDRAERVLIKGPTDSGKSTLMVSIIKRAGGPIVVVDPHYEPDYWPHNCRIVGKGRNHQEISMFFDWLSKEIDRRYQLRARGNSDYRPLIIIIDEWMSISTQCPNATRVITEMITESRKVKMRLFIGSHSDQVEALGIRGQGKLREGLLIVRLYYDQVTGQRRQTFDYGQGERECCLYDRVSEMLIDETADDKFKRIYHQTGNKSEACRQAYGREYAGNLVGKCKKLLGED